MTLRRLPNERGTLALMAAVLLAGAATGCGSSEPTKLSGQVAVTFIHSSDIHARLFPYKMQIGHIDANLGLGDVDSIVDVGGAARMSHIVGRERARASRSLYLDSGDPFQGAPVFNYFNGEAEMRTLSLMGLDAMALGNHEFDKGPLNAAIQIQQWADFPVLVSNYLFEDPTQPGSAGLGAATGPYQVFDLDGLKVAVIGMGSLSSLTSIYDMPNKLGITPLSTDEVMQFYVDLLRPVVDLVVVVSHLGVNSDEAMIKHTTGIDLVLGGHNHIALQPPKKVFDCARVDEAGQHYVLMNSGDDVDPGRDKPLDPNDDPTKVKRLCQPRQVILSHPGAFAKYLGRLDVVVSNDPNDFPPGTIYERNNGFEIIQSSYTLFPINASVPDDPAVAQLLEPYGQGLDATANLDLLVGYAPQGAPRYSTNGGDSALGNLIATAAWLRQGIQTEFSMTNTTGIRADIVPGAVSVEQMFNIFPFDNSISKMQLSGVEVQELFDFVARRSAGRACVSQVQIAGARLVLDCLAQPDPDVPPGVAKHIYIGAVEPELPCNSDADCCKPEAGCTGPDDVLGACDTNTARCWQPIEPVASYELATSNYLATGGSGFRVLQRNTTQVDTKVQQRDALIDFIRAGDPCGSKEDGTLWPCAVDADCQNNAELGDGFVCACPGNALDGEQCSSNSGVSCPLASGAPGPGDGACVLARCRDDVAAFERATCAAASDPAVQASCEQALTPCARGGEECKFLACLDKRLGNAADGRIRMVGK